jgi:pimeloyl-ACP methyl ester carboxylesterase
MTPMLPAGDGVELYTEVHGEGVPLLFSCALCTTHENWRPQVAPLVAAGARVILWDYRGHGRSGAPADGAAYSFDRVVDDLGRVLDAAAPGVPAVLAGLSFGGLASLHFTVRHPDRVRALVLADSGPGFKNPEAQANWERATRKTAAFIESKGLEAFAERAAGTLVGRRAELPATQRARAAIVAQDPVGVAHFARQVAARVPPVIDELAGIDRPALVVVGEKDDAYLRAADVMEAKLPRAERVTLAGAGHIVNLEAADAFNAALVDFFGRVTGS